MTPSGAWTYPVNGVLHGGGAGGGQVQEGSFVSNQGRVYRIAGGAPLYVSSWGAVGGPQTAVPLSDAQFAALPSVPADGTLLDASGGGVFVVAGGAPLYLSNYAAIGGARPGVAIDEWDIDNTTNPAAHLRTVPADGTLLDASGGGVFVVAGGAPLYLSNYAAIGGARPGVAIDEWDIDNTTNPAAHLRTVPADGTLLDASGGGVFVVAGGAPLYLSNYAAIGGARPGVAIDEWDIDNTTNPAAHLRTVPADGTLLDASGGGVFVVAGGAPLYLSNYAAIGGARPGVAIDEWDIDNTTNPAAHLRTVPADGTLLDASGGGVFVVAGGAPLYLSNYAAIGGARPGVAIDEWDIDNTTNPAAHLRTVPADGTFLRTKQGPVYRVAGGAPIYVSKWAAVGGFHSTVLVDSWDVLHTTNPVAHLRSYPANGTLVRRSNRQVFLFAGGAPLYVSNWAAVGGFHSTVLIDGAALDNAGKGFAWNYVRYYPVDRTRLRAGAKGAFYTVTRGVPTRTTSGAAVTVDPADITHAGKLAPWNHLK